MKELKELKDPVYALIKLDSSESMIIAQLMQENDTDLIVHYPLCIDIQHEQGMLGVATHRFFALTDNNMVAFRKEAIVAVAKPSPITIERYISFIQKWSSEDAKTDRMILDVREEDDDGSEPLEDDVTSGTIH